MSRHRKGDGRRAHGYTPVGPPAAGVVVERVDDHTLIVRSGELVTDEDADFIGEVLKHHHAARMRAILGIPEGPL